MFRFIRALSDVSLLGLCWLVLSGCGPKAPPPRPAPKPTELAYTLDVPETKLPSQTAQAPGLFAGNWAAEFTFDRNTANQREPIHPWFTFAVQLAQEGDRLRGRMSGTSLNVSGVISGQVQNTVFQGTMRLSWDQHDWELLTFTLTPDGKRAVGKAVFNANPNEKHVYFVAFTRL